jgi:hypothetical protein
LAVAAVTFIISLSSAIKGADNNSDVPLAEIDLTLKRLKTAASVSVNVIVIVSPDPESSDTRIDLITAVVAVGTVYNVVALVLVKSTFLLTNVLAIMQYRSFPLPPRLLNPVEMLNSVFVLHYLCHERKTVVSVDRILLKVGLMIVLF